MGVRLLEMAVCQWDYAKQNRVLIQQMPSSIIRVSARPRSSPSL